MVKHSKSLDKYPKCKRQHVIHSRHPSEHLIATDGTDGYADHHTKNLSPPGVASTAGSTRGVALYISPSYCWRNCFEPSQMPWRCANLLP